MMQARPHSPSRRAFFSRPFEEKQQDKHNWQAIEKLAAGNGDVFWTGWSDEDGIFVAGDNGVIFYYDGNEWLRQPNEIKVPIHAMYGNSRDELWAVGWMGILLKYQNGQWNLIQGCIIDDKESYASTELNTPLFAMDGANNEIWAVGDRGRILHFDGSDWLKEDAATLSHLRTVLALSNGQVMAAGGDGTVLLRTSKGDWQKLDCPIRSNYVAAIELNNGQVLLAGGRYFIDAHGFLGDLVLWDGTTFCKLFEGAEFSRFRDLAYLDGGVITIGDGGQIHVIEDGKIERIDSGTRHDLLGIVTLPTTELLAVGDFGTVLTADTKALEQFTPYIAPLITPSQWQQQSLTTDRQLWGAWYDQKNNCFYACGEEGVVLVHDRGQWDTLPPCNELGIHTLNRAADGGLLAAGQLGEIHHFDGQKWRKHFDLHMDITIMSLYCDEEGTIMAVGDEGLALQWNGQEWKRMVSGTRSALYGLWGLDGDHILSVGDFGLILRWNGESWDEFSAGTEQFLFDVWGRTLDDVYVVGLSGTIGHFNGERWRITPARARDDLLAVTGNQQEVIAVGAAGIATRHNGTNWALEHTGVDVGLRDIAADNHGRFMAVGDKGTIIIHDPELL